MSGALARKRDFDYSDYSKEDYFEEELEPVYQYAYSYHETLRPRRVARFALLDKISDRWRLLPKRWLLLSALGLFVCSWLFINALSILPKTDGGEQVYPFENTSLAPAQSKVSAPVPAASGPNALLRSPSISAERINAVLQQYRSPAVGTGQAIYELGVRYGIDPAFALAFFIHESGAGTQGVAAVTKSIGNIRCTSGYECYQTSGNGSFRRYSSWEAGAEDWFKLIKDLYITQWNLKTLEQIIPVYAPSADRNNPAVYIQQVIRLVSSF